MIHRQDEVETAGKVARTASTSANDRLGWVDCLRGIAILGVVSVHASQPFRAMGPTLYSAISIGRFGVDLFFAISGFVLYHAYQRNIQSNQYNSPRRQFLVARWARLTPVYFLGILFYGWILRLTEVHGPVRYLDIVANLTLLNGWIPGRADAIVPGGWSISAEATFALLFVGIVSWLNRPLSAIVLTVVSLAIAQLAERMILPVVAPSSIGDTWADLLEYAPWRYVSTFLVGVVSWHLWNRKPLASFTAVGWKRWVCGLAALGCLLLLAFDIAASTSRAIFAGIASMLLLITWADQPIDQWWHRGFRFLGQISFGVYLFHFAGLWVSQILVLAAFPIETPSSLLFVANLLLSAAFTLPLAQLSLILIEKPAHRYVVAWIARRVKARST